MLRASFLYVVALISMKIFLVSAYTLESNTQHICVMFRFAQLNVPSVSFIKTDDQMFGFCQNIIHFQRKIEEKKL